MKNKINIIEFILWFLGTVLVLFGVFEHLNYFSRTAPSNTTFAYADGYVYDYYQILSWIRQGQNGELLLLNRYTDEPTKPILIHPLYPLIGFITKPLGLSPFILFTSARIAGTLIFLASFAYLLRKLFPDGKIRFLTSLLFFTGTSFWSLGNVGGSFQFIEPVTGSLYFNIIGKFFLSPHHILALSCLFLILAFLAGKKSIRSPFHPVVFLTIIGGFLNPSLTLLFIGIILLNNVVLKICMLVARKQARKDQFSKPEFNAKMDEMNYPAASREASSVIPGEGMHRPVRPEVEGSSKLGRFLHALRLVGMTPRCTQKQSFEEFFRLKIFLWNSLFIIIPGALVILYHFYHFQHTPPWTTWYRHMLSYKPSVDFWEYIKALGPIFPLSFLSFLSIRRREKWFPLFVFWAYLPLAFFILKDSPLPLSYERVVQSYQYIPLSILGAVAIEGISHLFRASTTSKALIIGFSFFFITFAVLPYIFTIQAQRKYWEPGVYNVFIPNQGIAAFSYLERNTPKGSVVLSGEAISNMIPAFTDNKVILGRSDATENYPEKQTRAYAFLDGKLTQQQALQFLQDYHISHLLLGIDTIPFHGSKVDIYPFLQEVFRDGYVNVVQVVL